MQLVCLVDLEYDYINPYDSSSRINSVILPEFIVQGVLCFILLIAQHWFMLFMALPHLYYNVNLYMTRRHLVDVTEIYNQLSWEKKQRFFKIGYLLALFILSLFWHCCYGALETNTINHTSLLPPSFAHRKLHYSLISVVYCG
ncbi:hypothetical protein DVH24_026030 [Malus domestica]|uniref:Uncharacterized protein n=1 Tax=Malus domestica TaxID=3750 RepID=A0A498KKC9_MALDO|nr:hypothetical protein DVH24_026030 [Malus domestica]